MAHRATCRVIYGDTDTMGFAYHSNYLRWFEIGRTELFRAFGLPYKSIEEKGLFLPVSEAHLRFVAPVQYDDLLIIETALDPAVKGGMKFDYTLFTDGDDKVRATGVHPSRLRGPKRAGGPSARLYPRGCGPHPRR